MPFINSPFTGYIRFWFTHCPEPRRYNRSRANL